MSQTGPGYRDQAARRTIARVVGIACMGTALVLIAIAVTDLFRAASSEDLGAEPTKFWLFFLALPFFAVGGFALQAGFLWASARYAAGELAPTAREALRYLDRDTAGQRCAACGSSNDAAARFCDDCGQPLGRTCPGCRTSNAGDARFCADCGVALV